MSDSLADIFSVDEQSIAIKNATYWYLQRPNDCKPAAAPTKPATASAASSAVSKSSPAKPAAPAPKVDDDDADFLSKLSDDDDEDGEDAVELLARKKALEKDAVDEETRKAAARGNKKAAKSTLILDIKPEDDETSLDELEAAIRKECSPEGLLWGECQRIPIAFGIKKLRMIAVVVDDLVSVDDLQESIEKLNGVQSTDIHAFNKI